MISKVFPNSQHWNIVRWNRKQKTPDFPARTQMKIGNVFCFRNALVLRAKIQTSTWIVHSIAQFTVAIAANIHISPSISYTKNETLTAIRIYIFALVRSKMWILSRFILHISLSFAGCFSNCSMQLLLLYYVKSVFARADTRSE